MCIIKQVHAILHSQRYCLSSVILENTIQKALFEIWFYFSSSNLQRRQWHPTPALLPGKSHGWRSLVGCSPWGRQESDRTGRHHFHFSLSNIGEGNGNPPQCSCLEKPRHRGAWWAAVYGVAQSQTRLKRLSSGSSSRNLKGRYDMALWKKCTILDKISFHC